MPVFMEQYSLGSYVVGFIVHMYSVSLQREKASRGNSE